MRYATLAVTAGTLLLDFPSSLDAVDQSGGLLDFAGGAGLNGPILQTAGTMEVASEHILEIGGGSFAGTLTGAGEIQFARRNVIVESGLVLNVASLVIEDTTILAASITDAGSFTLAAGGTIDLAGHLFTVRGDSSFSGVLEGPGVLLIGAYSGIVGIDGVTATGGATIHDFGGLIAAGPLTLGTSGAEAATPDIGAMGTYDLVNTNGIAGSCAAVMDVNGILEDTNNAGTTSIAAGVIDDSNLIAIGGTLSGTQPTDVLEIAAGTFTMSGTDEVSAGFGAIAFSPGVVNTNLACRTLTGGTWCAGAGSLDITGGPITTDAAAIELFAYYNQFGEFAAGDGTSFTPIGNSVGTIAAGGVLEVSSQSYVSTQDVLDDGTIELSGGDQFGALSIGGTGNHDAPMSMIRLMAQVAGADIETGGAPPTVGRIVTNRPLHDSVTRRT